MTRVGFEPTPSNDDQEAMKLNIKVDLNLTPWTNSAILPGDVLDICYYANIKKNKTYRKLSHTCTLVL